MADDIAPAGGDHAAPAPELAPPPEGPVTTSSQTQGPPQSPPHGDPADPAQPRT